MASVIPLESNPEIFTQFAHKLGLTELLSFYDVYSITEPDLLLMLPRPIYAIILLFPITANYEKERLEQIVENDESVKWFPQEVKNSCGFHALLHILANMSPNLILDNSLLDNFNTDLAASKSDSAKLIEKLIFSSNNLYEEHATLGQTEAPTLEYDTNLHFASFVKLNDSIFELDGRRKSLVKLGKASHEGVDIIEEEVIRDKILHYVDIADEENKMNFSMIGLGPSFG